MHLLYAREWTKMMRDIGLVEQDEPFKRLFNQGQILGLDGERMSKSRGNTVDPDDLVARYGADTVRLFLMFMGPWDQGGPWSPTGIGGVHRFLNRVWTLRHRSDTAASRAIRSPAPCPPAQTETDAATAIRSAAHKTLRDVTGDYEAFHFNTMIAKLMELANTLIPLPRHGRRRARAAWDEAVSLLLLMLAPAAPHITEELWGRRLAAAGKPWASIHTASLARGRSVRGRRVDPRDPRPGQRQAARQGGRAGRRIRGRASRRRSWPATRSRRSSTERAPDRIIVAGGGKLVNLVVR